LPRVSFATPIVADCPFVVFGGAEEPFALAPPPLPQAAIVDAESNSAVALPRKVMDLVRIMLAPFVGCVSGSHVEHAAARWALASRSPR
jgi:hypothetical protein